MIYLISTTVFSGVILLLVGMLLLLEAKVVRKGDRSILINDDREKSLTVSSGGSLLASLVNNGIFLPSACGGGGSCGQCRCRVNKGGGDILPTELPHLTRMEKKEGIRLACQVKVREDMEIEISPEVFNIKKYTASVLSNRNVATFIKELVLQLDPGQELDFESGAYMQIDIPEYEIPFSSFDVAERFAAAWEKFNLRGLCAKGEEPVYRAYSLASYPAEGDVLRFTVRIATPPPDKPDVPPGVGSSYVFSLKRNDRVTLSGPYGDFFVKKTDREMCFVGGGAGMAPMRSHIFHQLKTVGTGRKMSFWYGARSRQEMFYDEEFRELANRFDNFEYHVALSEPQPEDNWEGLVGFVHQCLHEEYLNTHPDPTEIEYYLCGPPMMIKAVSEMLDSLGVEPGMIAYDAF